MPQQRTGGLFDDESQQQQPAGPLGRPPGGGLFDVEPDPLRNTLDQAAKTGTPDQAARVFNLRLKTGLPPAYIEQHLDEVERQAATKGFDPARFRRESPELAKWLQQDGNAALAHDDLPALSTLERALHTARTVGGAALTGPLNISSGFWGLTRMGAELAGANGLADYAANTQQVAQYLRDRVRGTRGDEGWMHRMVLGGVESASTSMTAFLAAGPLGLTASRAAGVTELGLSGAAAAAPAAAASSALAENAVIGTLSGVTAGDAYQQARDAGRGPGMAALFATVQGVVEGLTEKIPMHYLLEDLKHNAGLRQILVHQAMSEIPGEEVATALQDLNEWAVLRPDATFMDYLKERPSAIAETFVSTLVTMAAQGSVVHGIERASGKSLSEGAIQGLHDAAAASKTGERAPAALASFVEAAAKAGLTHVYAPTSSFVEYFQQQGQDPIAEATKLTGDPDALKTALNTGADLQIPTARYLSQVVGSGHESFFTQELRLSPDQENAREVRERMKAEADSPAADDAEAVARRQVFDSMVAKLEATGRYTRQEAETQAQLYTAVFSTATANRATPQNPQALLERHGGEVASHGQAKAAAREGTRLNAFTGPSETTPDIPPSVAKPGESGTQRQARRRGHLAALTSAYTRAALALDPTVDPAHIADQVALRVDMAEERARGEAESGHGRDLLRAIAQRGGIVADADLQDLATEGHDRRKRGTVATKRGHRTQTFGKRTWNGVAGVFTKDGQTPDLMTRSLMQDERFAHLGDDVNELKRAVDAAMRAGEAEDAFPGTKELKLDPATRWWEQGSGQQQADEVTEDDDSFDVAAFEQRVDERLVEAQAKLRALGKSSAFPLALNPPFPVVTTDEAMALWRAAGGLNAVHREQVIPLDQVVATQDWVFPATAYDYSRRDADQYTPPIALHLNGRFYLTDGHHRSTGAWANGERTILARVAEVDPQRLATQPVPRTLEARLGERAAAAIAQAHTTFEQTDTPLILAPAEYRNGRLVLSTRIPTGEKGREREGPIFTRLDALDEPEAGTAKDRYASVAREQSLLTEAEKQALAKDPDATLDKFVSRMTQNLRWLWNQVPAKQRARAKQWYVGAHRIAVDLATHYGTTNEQAAAVLAALSPNKVWFMNVSLARRVFAIYHDLTARNPVFDRALFDHLEARNRAKKRKDSPQEKIDRDIATARQYVGMRWKDLDLDGKAIMLREIDERAGHPEYHVITPEGGYGDLARTADGTPARVTWQSYYFIGNAISLLEDGSAANIHATLGEEHKVRSFFNNISDPDGNHSVTIDSHAVAAAFLQPFTGDSKEVKDTLGGRPNASNAGLSGFNVVVAEAYFRLAAQLSKETGRRVLAREVQSVTWEAIRSLFPAEQKNESLTNRAAALWGEFTNGLRRADSVRARLRTAAGGFAPLDWADSPTGVDAHGRILHPRHVLPGAAGIPGARGNTRRHSAAAQARRQSAAQPDGVVRTDGKQAGRDQGVEFRQDDAVDAPFYSRLQRAVESSTLEKASGAQWKATIKNSKAGISQDEYQYVSVDALEDGKTYTRDQVLAHLQANQVKVEWTTFGDNPVTDDAIHAYAENLYDTNLQAEISRIEDQALDQGYGPRLLDVDSLDFHHDEDAGAISVRADDGEEIERFDLEEGHDELTDEQMAELAATVERLNESEQGNFEEEIRRQAEENLDPFDTFRATAEHLLREEHEGSEPKYEQVLARAGARRAGQLPRGPGQRPQRARPANDRALRPDGRRARVRLRLRRRPGNRTRGRGTNAGRRGRGRRAGHGAPRARARAKDAGRPDVHGARGWPDAQRVRAPAWHLATHRRRPGADRQGLPADHLARRARRVQRRHQPDRALAVRRSPHRRRAARAVPAGAPAAAHDRVRLDAGDLQRHLARARVQVGAAARRHDAPRRRGVDDRPGAGRPLRAREGGALHPVGRPEHRGQARNEAPLDRYAAWPDSAPGATGRQGRQRRRPAPGGLRPRRAVLRAPDRRGRRQGNWRQDSRRRAGATRRRRPEDRRRRAQAALRRRLPQRRQQAAGGEEGRRQGRHGRHCDEQAAGSADAGGLGRTRTRGVGPHAPVDRHHEPDADDRDHAGGAQGARRRPGAVPEGRGDAGGRGPRVDEGHVQPGHAADHADEERRPVDVPP